MKDKKKKLNRFTAFFLIIAVIYSILIFKLGILQIKDSEQYKERASRTAITEVPDAAPRGPIIDKNGSILATNIQSYILVYNETSDNKKYFFETMDKVFNLLDSNGEKIQDELELKINPYRFEFKTNDVEARKTLEIRFKRDRGLNEAIQKKIFPDKKDNFTEEEIKAVNEELLKITPEQTYKLLVEKYKIYPKEDFKNLLEQYVITPEETYPIIVSRFNIKSTTEFKDKLDKYKNAKSNKKKEILEGIISEYGIDKMEYPLEKQRKYLIIKDTMTMQSFSGYKPVVIESNIKRDTAFIFLERLNDLSGIDVITQPVRYYPNGKLGSAFLGYISKINNPDQYKDKGYDISSDYVGVSGLEAVFEDRLKGSKGGRIVKLNRQGRIIEELFRKEPYPGQTMQLTIDNNVQKAAEDALEKTMQNLRDNPNVSYDGVNTSNATRGAAVAIDVNTGGILALVSNPGFDPNIFSMPGKLTSELYQSLFNPDYEAFAKDYIAKRSLSVTVDELFPIQNKESGARKDEYDIFPKPFFNYATSSFIAPGSTFKPLTAIAGLEEGLLGPNETIYDNLVYTKHGYQGRSWNYSSKGSLNAVEALAYSNNYFFFEVGDRLYEKGLDTLAEYAWKFGLGAPHDVEKPSTGIEIPELFGQVFNVQSEKNKASNIYIWSLYDELLQLRKVKGTNDYEGIDLRANDTDSQEVKDLKKKIYDTIIKHMRYRDVPNFSDTVKAMLKELIQKSPTMSAKKFTDGDISAAMSKVYKFVYAVEEEALRPGNVYNASIGQGSNYFTPLQLANFSAMIANGGTRYKLHLVDKFLDAEGNTIQEYKPEVMDKIDLKPETLRVVREGMHAVSSYDEGTGASAFRDFPIVTAGKTGSSTFREGGVQEKVGRTSSGVYIGYAPYDNPQIAVCVIIFDGGHGGSVNPVAKAMYEAYFKEELTKQNYNFQHID
ncbi:penicillin-binding transpeptidase domain-containing protein [uncultured Clostridium sp.]|uniref:penicillin-binding transpeptidase domain-containing protein n=1 Tax=uncultured Clostridium sp. TaxID=59620 RepID=UPI0028E9FD70|nr:penicillin-binding transpeptidase domain-containing protein [uncultured Clostridium sp.]